MSDSCGCTACQLGLMCPCGDDDLANPSAPSPTMSAVRNPLSRAARVAMGQISPRGTPSSQGKETATLAQLRAAGAATPYGPIDTHYWRRRGWAVPSSRYQLVAPAGDPNSLNPNQPSSQPTHSVPIVPLAIGAVVLWWLWKSV